MSDNSKRYLGRWFRFYETAIDDPKVQTLPDALFRTWVNLLCLASGADGDIPNGEQLAFRLRLSKGNTRKHIDTLIAAGLIDKTECGFRPHNWSERQFRSDTSAARMRTLRRRRSVGDVGDVTSDDGDDGYQSEAVTSQGASQSSDVTVSPSVYSEYSVLRTSNQDRKVSGYGCVGTAAENGLSLGGGAQ